MNFLQTAVAESGSLPVLLRSVWQGELATEAERLIPGILCPVKALGLAVQNRAQLSNGG
jgi:hypothetical protein